MIRKRTISIHTYNIIIVCEQSVPPGAAGRGAGSAAAEPSREPSSPARTPVQWVEGLVQQMASAQDVADARGRAANELRAFEQVVMQTANRVSAPDPLMIKLAPL